MAKFQDRARIATFYHASPVKFRRGALLTGGHSGGYGSAHSSVCMTDCAAPHATIAGKAIEGNWYVYLVAPEGPVSYVGGNGEYQARAATVVDCVGRAQALAARVTRGALRDKYSEGKPFVSYVPRPRLLRGVRVHPHDTNGQRAQANRAS